MASAKKWSAICEDNHTFTVERWQEFPCGGPDTFPCGDIECAIDEQWCLVNEGSDGPSYSCEPLPAPCQNNADAGPDYAPASAVLSGCLVESNARAGLAAFSASVGLTASAIRCNTIDMNSESHGGAPGTFEDLGYNSCGCGSEGTVCQAVSAGLEPPLPVLPGG
ncbi:MAG: hypothetical protein JRI68_25170 [Deltaproteobacteria bacterium]|nr:hypothetical protein [Deltaproteobacteria bacterium]